MDYFWAEHYLIQAFLAFNRDFEVLIPANAVAVEHPSGWRGRSLVRRRAAPRALWLRRR